MNNFWSLVGFEYKKVFTKRTIIIFVLMLALISVSAVGILIGNVYVDGEITDSKYNDYMIDKAYSLSLQGQVLDAELLKTIITSYANYPVSATLEEQREAVQTHIRPYFDAEGIIKAVYGTGDYSEIGAITDEQIASFYDIRTERIIGYINSVPINETSKTMLLEMSANTQTPIVMGYSDSYMLAMAMMDSSALIMSFFVAFIFAGLFAKEYQTGIIAIQLTSKNGKSTLFKAKIFTLISAASLVILTTLAVNFITCMVAYGTEGAQTALQNKLPFVPYAFTVLEATLVDYFVILCASLFFGVLIIWLSSFLKTPFVVLAIGVTILLIPIFVPIPETLPTLYKFFALFPSNSFLYLNNFSVLLYELPFVSLPPYIFVPIFYVLTSTILILFSYRAYKNYQVR